MGERIIKSIVTEKVIKPVEVKEILVCTDCGCRDVVQEEHDHDHHDYDRLKARYDEFEIGCHVKGVWRQYVYHTEPDNMIDFDGIVCARKVEKNLSPRVDERGNTIGVWGDYYIYNWLYFLLEKANNEREWVDIEKITEYKVSAKN